MLMMDVFLGLSVTTTTNQHLSNELVVSTHEPNHSFSCQFPFLFTGEWKHCLLHK